MTFRQTVARTTLTVASFWLSGCLVPESRYDKAVDRMQAEEAAHRAAEEKLHQVEQKLAYAEGLLDEQHESIEKREQQLARAELRLDRVATERDDASEMVDQLRGELGRAGDHLRSFSEQKHRLQTALESAEERAEELERAERDLSLKIMLMRDLTFALAGQVQKDRAAIAAVSGHPVVRVPVETLFSGKATGVRDEGRSLVHRIAVALAPYERSRVEVTELPGDAPAAKAEIQVVRLQSIADILSEAGVGFERVTLALPPDAAEPAEGAGFTDEEDATGASATNETEQDSATAPGGTEKSADDEGAVERADGKRAPSWRQGPASVQFTVTLAPPKSSSE